MYHVKPNGTTWRHGRARLDLSAEEAADRLRISPKYLWNIEANHPRATPSERLVYRASALYGVPFGDLVSKDEKPDKDPKPDKEREERLPDPSGPRTRPDRDRKGPPRTDSQGMRAAS